MKNIMKQLCMVVVGSIIMGVGIALCVISNLGADPLTMLWQGFTNLLPMTLGQANLFVSGVILLIVFFLDKKQIHIGSFLNPIFIGLTTDFILPRVTVELPFVGNLGLMLIGLLILSFGVAFYALGNLGRGAYEALVFALVERLHRSIKLVRTSFDVIFALLGVIMGVSLTIGPILAIFALGNCIQFFVEQLSKVKLLQISEF